MMNSRERFEATMKHRQPDCAPFDIGGVYPMSWLKDQTGLADFLGLPGDPKPAGAWGFDERIQDWAETDFRGVGKIVNLPGKLKETVSPTCKVDCWGIRWEFVNEEWQITNSPLQGVEDVETLINFPWPEPRIDEALLESWAAQAEALHARNKPGVMAEHPVYGVMELGAWMFGYENYLFNLAAEPDVIRWFNDKVLEIQLEVSRQYYSALGPYIDLTTSGDDFGTQQGLIISPDMFAEMIAPWFRERIRFTKETANCYYWHHSCGAIFELLDQLIDYGVDILNPIQTSAAGMNPADLKQTYGDRLIFWGAMDVQIFLPSATPDEVRAKTRELIDVLGRDGGYVMAPGHEIGTDIPYENIVAWVEEMITLRNNQD